MDVMHSNVLIVDRLPNNDNFIVGISSKTKKKLNITHNNLVKISSSNCSNITICSVQIKNCEHHKILMGRIVRHNLNVRLNDAVSILPCLHIRIATHISIALIDTQSAKDLTQNICKDLLNKYFGNYPTPICKGNKIIIKKDTRAIEFIITDIKPKSCCITNYTTKICLFDVVIENKVKGQNLSDISYDDVKGQNNQLAELREIEFSLRFPNLLNHLQIISPQIILYGPKGVGKVLLAHALANESGAYFTIINGYDITNNTLEKSLLCLLEKFQEANMNLPSVICIDGIDLIAPKKLNSYRDNILTNELAKLIKRIENSPIVLIGVINHLTDTDITDILNDEIFFLFNKSPMSKQIKFKLPDYANHLK